MRGWLCLWLLCGCGGELSSLGSDEDGLAACQDGEELAFTVEPAVHGTPFVGFGAQYNQNLFASINGVTDVGGLRPKLASLAAQHVRIFFDSRALTDADLLQSFQRTVALAEEAGATINITWWHGPYPDPAGQMRQFAAVLEDLVRTRGLAAVRYVTIQNEVSSTAVTMANYARLYRTLDGELRARGLRQNIDLVGGDLLAENQAAWIDFLGHQLADVLDGYSVHIYWDYRDPGKLRSRLDEVRRLVDALPASGRKPLYVTEFGVRGARDSGEAQPGHVAGGGSVERDVAAVMQQGWFDLYALSRGFVATVRWDAYYSMYDQSPQYFSLIGMPQNGWPLKPSYHLLRMLTHTVDPGWRSSTVNGGSSNAVAVALRGAGETTLLLVNASRCRRRYRLAGLPAQRSLYFISWNGDGKGELAAHPRPRTGSGQLTVTLSPQSLVALSTRFPGLGL